MYFQIIFYVTLKFLANIYALQYIKTYNIDHFINTKSLIIINLS